jgi:hypothetical protein
MAIGPVGSAIYTNQQTPIVATLKAENIARLDFQNMVAQTIVNEEEKRIQEVRPTEENQEVDPDREHQKEEMEQRNKRSKKQKQISQEEENTPLHKLDIKV